MSAAWQRIERYFADQGWELVVGEPADGRTGADGDGAASGSWAYRGENGEWYGQIAWLADVGQLLIYSIFPFPVPKAARRRMGETVLKVNSELVVGCFECDMAAGLVRFRTGVPVTEDDLADELIDRLIRTNIATVDRYLPELVRVAAGIPGDDPVPR